MPGSEGKSFAIPRPMVWEAWRRVRANKGAPGVDGQAIEEFEADLAGNLYVLAGIAARVQEVGLRLHPDKTRIVYCKDGRRRAEHEHTSFTFLGHAFRARGARAKNGRNFTGFLPAISPEALKAKGAELRRMRIHRRTDLSLDDLARWLNPIVAGWINYYCRFYRTALDPLLKRVNAYLRRWAGRKYKRLRTDKRFSRWWTALLERQPGLFAHWRTVRTYHG
jgi:RNA-directed DNA polymerase